MLEFMSIKALSYQILKVVYTIIIFCNFASAQLATGSSPETVASEAVEAWLKRAEKFELSQFFTQEPEGVCEELSTLGQLPNLIKATEVNFDDVNVIETSETAHTYTYAAKASESLLGQVKVQLSQTNNGEWEADSVRLYFTSGNPSPLSQINYPITGWIFLFFSFYLAYLCSRPSFFRSWLIKGVEIIKAHRRIVLGTIIALYSAFVLGIIAGSSMPETCHSYITEMLSTGVSDIGIVEVLESGDIARIAAAISFWNFSMGAIVTTLLPASLFAVPAYLFNFSRFFYLAIPFADVPPAMLLVHLPVIIIELLAYTLITAGGGIFLATLIRQGWKGYREGLKKLFLIVPIALVLLVFAAWYESLELLWIFSG